MALNDELARARVRCPECGIISDDLALEGQDCGFPYAVGEYCTGLMELVEIEPTVPAEPAHCPE